MTVKSIGSTEAQNNFGRILDDVALNRARYIIQRRGVSQAVVLSFDDLVFMLTDDDERQKMRAVLQDLRPRYSLGQVIDHPQVRE